jgi:TolB protein
MLYRRFLCIGFLALPALPVLAQGQSRAHRPASAHTTDARVRAVVLPVEGADGDSIHTIIARDLDYGDRVQIVDASQTKAAGAVIKAVAAGERLNVSLLDPATGIVRQQQEFTLPVVTPQHDREIADSLNNAFNARDAQRRERIVSAERSRDSLQAEMAKKPPKLKNKKAKAQYAALVSQHNTMLRDILAQIAMIQGERERDQSARVATQASAIARDAELRDSAAHARRWAIHGVADALSEWLTGHRGIAQSRVAYVSNGVIRVVDFDGANDHAVTAPDKLGDKAMSPSWRRDGRALVYSEMSDAGTQIAMVDLVTGKTQALAATPRGLNITPVFSADGKSVIYANGTDSRTSLVAVPLDNMKAVRHLPLNRAFDADEPIFSPDGSRIAYVSSRPKTPQIYSANLDGTDERVEAPAPPRSRVYHTSPDWSPDGSMIAYQQQNGDFQVWVVNRSSKKVRRLTSKGENEDPSWGPDARHIALTSNRGGAKAIWVLDIQTGRFRQLTQAGDARLAAWSDHLGATAPIGLASAR